jgi:hypothetical protein
MLHERQALEGRLMDAMTVSGQLLNHIKEPKFFQFVLLRFEHSSSQQQQQQQGGWLLSTN